MSVFDKWEKEIDTKALEESKKELEENGSYEEVPHGEYEVKVEKLETVECKSDKNKGEKMVSIWFKIVSGKFKGSYIFYNKLYSTYDFMRYDNAKLLASLMDIDAMQPIINDVLKSNDHEKIDDLLMDIHEEIDGKFEYLLAYQVNKKGYDVFTIKEVFDV